MRIALVATLLFHHGLLGSQAPLLGQQRFDFDHLSVKDGLSHGTVRHPCWNTWWLRGGAALMLTGIFAGVHVVRTRVISYRNRELELVNKKLNDQIAERRRTEKEKEKLIGDLAARATEMERFVYTVSHDLKSPLITIKGFLGMAQADARAGDIGRMSADLEKIGVAADKMNYLLEDLLELARVGRVLNPPEQVSLRALAEEACELVAGRISEKNAKVEIQPDLPETTGDRARLLEVF